jgi:hypothetical protein
MKGEAVSIRFQPDPLDDYFGINDGVEDHELYDDDPRWVEIRDRLDKVCKEGNE